MSENGQDDDQTEADLLRTEVEAFRNQFTKPQVTALQDRMDELEEENERQQAQIDDLQAQVDQLDTQVENLIGVDDPDLSTHDKRVRDVRAAMIRRAEAKEDKRSDNIVGKVALSYSEIQNLLADHGHGDVYKPQAYRIMDDIENVDGFTKGTKHSEHGHEVKAIRVSLDVLPAYARGNNVTTSGTGGRGENHPNSTKKHKQS